MKYHRYRTTPSNTRAFHLDFLNALEKGQIIVTFITDERPGTWDIWLMPYSENDWKEGNTKDDWKTWNREVLRLNGSWESFLVLRDYPSTDFQKQTGYRLFKRGAVDIRLKPRRGIPFAFIGSDREESMETIISFLNKNIGEEHTNVSLWSDITQRNVKDTLCRKITEDVEGCARYIDQLSPSPIVLRKQNKADLVGGHTTLTEFMDSWAALFTLEMADKMTAEDFETVHDRAEKEGFLREMREELGLERKEDYDYRVENQNITWMGYVGHKTGVEKPIWIILDRSDPVIPLQIQVALAVDVTY